MDRDTNYVVVGAFVLLVIGMAVARYPVIHSAPSDIAVLIRRLPELANHAIELVGHMDQVFSEENVRAFKATLQNAQIASERAPALLKEIEQMVADIRHASDDVDSAAADLRSVTDSSAPDLKATLANVRASPRAWRAPRTA